MGVGTGKARRITGISGNNRKTGVKMLTFANLFRECQIELQRTCGYIA